MTPEEEDAYWEALAEEERQGFDDFLDSDNYDCGCCTCCGCMCDLYPEDYDAYDYSYDDCDWESEE
jgi:hypothetical protein